MIYVMSDLHGEYDKFIKMLKLIEFSPSDKLYILGDVIDRGEKSLEILDYIRKEENSNIELLPGNHEKTFVEAMKNDDYFYAWLTTGNGAPTYNELKAKSKEYLQELIEYISNLASYVVLDKYILVHAGINIYNGKSFDSIEELLEIQTDKDLFWNRDFAFNNEYIDGYTVICGHTPTMNVSKFKDKAEILNKKGKVLIDCGASFTKDGGRLGCLRLDDLKEFYID